VTTEHTSVANTPLPLPEAASIRQRKFGSRPVSPLVPTPVGGDRGDASAPRAAYKIRWEDCDQGLTVVVRERDNGHLVADVFSTDTSLLGKAAVSVGLVGSAGDETIRVSIFLDVPEEDGCSGSADLGPLAEAVVKLGPELGVVVFLLA
jgi:hypothetical protein